MNFYMYSDNDEDSYDSDHTSDFSYYNYYYEEHSDSDQDDSPLQEDESVRSQSPVPEYSGTDDDESLTDVSMKEPHECQDDSCLLDEVKKPSQLGFCITQIIGQREVEGSLVISRQNMRKHLTLSILKARWLPQKSKDLCSDAKTLLGRELKKWEYDVIHFLSLYGINKASYRSDPKYQQQSTLNDLFKNHKDLVNISFAEILNLYLINNVDLNCSNSFGQDIFKILRKNNLKDHTENIIDFLVEHVVDVSHSGHHILIPLCCAPSKPDQSMSSKRLMLIEKLLKAGIKCGSSKANALTKFLKNYYFRANDNSVEVVRLLVNAGFVCDDSLFTFDANVNLHPEQCPIKHFENALVITEILVNKGARLNPSRRGECNILHQLLAFTAMFNSHPSMLDLFRLCIDKGLDLKAQNNITLLLDACANYRGKDLVELIELLCRNGIDINMLDTNRRNALFALTRNKSDDRQAIYDAAVCLIKEGIDINHTDEHRLNVLYYFMMEFVQFVSCCYYGNLILGNKTKFWNLLSALLDAGIKVNEAGFPSSIFSTFKMIASENNMKRICSDCSKKCPIAADSVSLIDLWADALSLLDKLLKAEEKTENVRLGSNSKRRFNLLCYVCSKFQEIELLAIVELLCKNGADVNGTWVVFVEQIDENNEISGRLVPQYINAIDTLKLNNPSQIHLLPDLINILKKYGFNEDA